MVGAMNIDATKGRVLIVDSDRSLLQSYRDLLSRAGFEVTGSIEASDALRRIDRDQFDVFISDVNVPEMNGLALFRKVRERFVNLQLVLILESPNNDVSLQAAELGVFQSLIKPIEPDTLERAAALGVRLNREKVDSAALKIRNRLYGRSASFTATEAKNEFGRVLEKAILGELVLITKHDTPKAVLLSMDEFTALSGAPELKINTLSAEFDSLLARMQGPAARKAMDNAFHASSKQLGKAALAGTRRRRG
jgi:prevent-host-death family protein